MAGGRFEHLDRTTYALPAGIEERLCSPALVVFLDRVRRNVERVIGYAGGADRWRPHLKTTKLPAVWAELLAAGVRHFKCATVREARHLAQLLRARGIEGGDVLVAYPLVGPALGQLADLARDHAATRFSVLCEDADAAPRLPQALGVYVDLDPGMRRTGIPLADGAAIEAVARGAGDRFRGVHHYEGHLHGEPLVERRAAIHAGYAPLLERLEALERAGLQAEELITSGTPAFRHALDFAPFRDPARPRHRVSPGTVVFHDARSARENPDLELEPAACLFTRVVSRARPGAATCDAGSKSLAAEGDAPCAVVLGEPTWEAGVPSEEHLPLRIPEGPSPPRGASLLLVPEHVCPTVNLAEEALLVDGGRWERHAVVARAHDLFAEA